METALLSMAQQFSGLPMEALIGGPLNAAATANSQMALTQTKFMLDTCFNKEVADNKATYKPIMIEMTLIRGVLSPGTSSTGADGKVTTTDPSIQQMSTTFNLPLLTIVPLNSLAVDNVDITFEMEVKSSFAEDQEDTSSTEAKAEATVDASLNIGPFSVSIKGSASYDHKDSSTHSTHYQKSNSAKYTVNVHAGQLPLPKGVNTIIEAFTQSIQPITLPRVDGGKPDEPGK